MLYLSLTNESKTRMDQFFQNVEDFPEKIKDDVFEFVFGIFGQIIDREFESGGYPNPWKKLSLWTELDKLALHYFTGILIREGFLWRSLTELQGPRVGFVKEVVGLHIEDRPIQTGNLLEMQPVGDQRWRWQFRTLDERFIELDEVRPMIPEEEIWEQHMIAAEPDLFDWIERKAKF